MVEAMSLIKCPECGKEISDKSEICINCGYPIKNFILTDINNLLYEIDLCLKSIKIQNETLNNFEQTYNKLEEYVKTFLSMKQQEEKIIEFNDKLLIMLYGSIEKLLYYLTPDKSCDLFSLVDFSNVSNNTQKIFVEKIDNLLTKEGAFDDDSISSQSYIILWYPLFEMIKNFNSDNTDFIYSKLCEKTKKQKAMNFPSIMEYISTTARKYTFMKQISEHNDYIDMIQNQNIPKCPMCGSTNISKISTISRATSIIGFGILSKKIGKQWQCNNPKCRHMW